MTSPPTVIVVLSANVVSGRSVSRGRNRWPPGRTASEPLAVPSPPMLRLTSPRTPPNWRALMILFQSLVSS
ncbi:MAG: hypothetical protein QM733_16485 [Ilumatobacteraceae bacterium]